MKQFFAQIWVQLESPTKTNFLPHKSERKRIFSFLIYHWIGGEGGGAFGDSTWPRLQSLLATTICSNPIIFISPQYCADFQHFSNKLHGHKCANVKTWWRAGAPEQRDNCKTNSHHATNLDKPCMKNYKTESQDQFASCHQPLRAVHGNSAPSNSCGGTRSRRNESRPLRIVSRPKRRHVLLFFLFCFLNFITQRATKNIA